MKVICAQSEAKLKALPAGARGILVFSRSNKPTLGTIGTSVRHYIERKKLVPSDRAWDFVALALSVFAADQAVPRENSPDGWTREIELDIGVSDPNFWNSQRDTINSAVQFLTTDRWSVSFSGPAKLIKIPKKRMCFTGTSVSLLSGGLDSLIGAVDLAAANEKVLLVSQVASGDRGRQAAFAKAQGLAHLQLTHGCELPGVNEPSTRSRSIVFIAYGVLAATLLKSYDSKPITMRTPENGYMSINPPLTLARLGGLSTRTTHPVFIHYIQKLLDAAGLHVKLENPYQFKTKGEMLKDCLNQDYIRANAHKATSCGRFVRTQYRHCGRCIPCLVRRASFKAASLPDRTDYKYKVLKTNDADHARFDDVRSAAMAAAIAKTDGLNAWLGTSLLSNVILDQAPYREVVGKGLDELANFLKAAGVK